MAHTKIILISAAIDPAHAPDGITAVLAKPFDLATIEGMVQRLL